MSGRSGGTISSEAPRLWYERVYARVRLPMWAGALLFACFPFLLVAALGFWAAGVWNDFLQQLVPSYIPFAALLFLTHYLVRHICIRVEGLQAYAQSMSDGRPVVDLGRLYRFAPVLAVWAILLVTTNPLYILAVYPTYSPTQILLTTISIWPYALLFAASFFWVWGYSMFLVYKMGKLPLSLQPFTEGPLLGLRPFAQTSLRLTTIYLAVIATVAVPQILTGFAGPYVTLMYVGFLFLGIVFFLLPLLPLRRKLRAAKSAQDRWIDSEYSKLMQSVRSIHDDCSETVVGQLMAIDKIQRDIRQIRTWPFEAGILARLIAIVLSVTAIILSQILATLLNL